METDGRRRRTRLGAGAVIVLVLAVSAVTVAVGVVRTLAAPTVSVQRSDAGGGGDEAGSGTGAEGLEDAGAAGGAASGSADIEVSAGTLYVHVAGAVMRPGLYRLAAGARVVDGVAAAGGLAPDADAAAINLARTLDDGEQLLVPRVGEAPPPASGTAAGGAGAAAGGKIDLNTADAAALETLPRIGPALAERILQWREDNGRFTSVDDLLSVPGIGDKLLAGLRDLVRV
ncbi:ComEA family DNA-binding protein [Microbacterium telephonicum]|uniref:Competence protein ComEA n=1 Tax=Microbacterium telephonicum TaxID=1714841 RepID=A0A498CB83_9MICO|nr:ComEA family DNA-binding protein [Microbacterium telephonicum]RLK49521.1 competence protein ComEA [Microbacterium telephonicum]